MHDVFLGFFTAPALLGHGFSQLSVVILPYMSVMAVSLLGVWYVLLCRHCGCCVSNHAFHLAPGHGWWGNCHPSGGFTTFQHWGLTDCGHCTCHATPWNTVVETYVRAGSCRVRGRRLCLEGWRIYASLMLCVLLIQVRTHRRNVYVVIVSYMCQGSQT